MPAPRYQRLSGQDASFLMFEGPNTPMNVGGVSVFEAGPLLNADGGLDLARIKSYIASRLHSIPRYRQHLAYIPLQNQPIWVDDARFDLDYHVRHIALPRPGDDRQLQRLTADVLSRPLNRQRPLWELWLVEGLSDGRAAMITKAHHCMVDGVSGVDMASITMRTTPSTTIKLPRRWRPRPVPRGIELLRDDVLRRLRLPLAAVGRTAAAVPNPLRSDLGERLAAVWRTLRAGLRSAANTPFNQPTGPSRRFDWLSFDLEDIKQVKNRAGGTVNDVVLATAAGALRRFLKRRRVALNSLDLRVAVPVNMRASDDRAPGNRASVWLTNLPVQEPKPLRRLAMVRKTTSALKQEKQALGADVLMQVADWTGTPAVALGARLAARMSPYNLIITNVPGPQFPLYFLGARLLAAYPQVPLFDNQGLGIALFSYNGRMFWGFNADWDLVPDLHDLVEDVKTSFAQLRGSV